MAKLGDLVARIGANTKDFNKSLGQVQRDTRRMTGNISNLGRQMSMSLTLPIAALSATSVKAFDTQAKAIAQVEAGLKSTGNAAGFTSKQLQDMASSMQGKTLFGDEAILKDATAQLLTFTNITGDQFEKTQKIALDLATRLDGDLKSASIQLGKALNDPVKNLSALSRSGIQFSDEQKTLINTLATTGRMAEAQTVILKELENQYGGSAEAAAKAGTGPMQQLANSFGDLQEQFGEILLTIAVPLVDFFKGLVAAMQNMSPTTKKLIAVFSLLVAAVGPLLFLLPQIVSIAPLVGMAFTAMTGPIGIAVAAVVGAVALIVSNWDSITEYFTTGGGSEFMNEMVAGFSSAWESVQMLWTSATEALKSIWDAFGGYYVEGLKIKMQILMKVIQFAFKHIAGLIEFWTNIARGDFGAAFDAMKGLAANAVNFIIDTYLALADVALRVADKIATAFGGGGFYEEATAKLHNFANGLKMVEDQAGATGEALTESTSGGGFELPSFDFGSGSQTGGGVGVPARVDLQPLTENDITGISSELPEGEVVLGGRVTIGEDSTTQDEAAQGMLNTMDVLQQKSTQVGDAVGGAFANMSGQLVDSLGLADTGMEGFVKNMAGTVTDLIAMFLSQSIASAIAGAQTSATATGPGAVLSAPAFIASMVGGVISAFAAIPQFAEGGIVSGKTLGIMGEYAGARQNPEVVAPLDKLRGMIADVAGQSESTGNLQAKIKGSDLVLMLERAERRVNRNR